APAGIPAEQAEDVMAACVLDRPAHAPRVGDAIGVPVAAGRRDARVHEEPEVPGPHAHAGVAVAIGLAGVAEAAVHRPHEPAAIPDGREAALPRRARVAVAATHLARRARGDGLRRPTAHTIAARRELDARAALAVAVGLALARRHDRSARARAG